MALLIYIAWTIGYGWLPFFDTLAEGLHEWNNSRAILSATRRRTLHPRAASACRCVAVC
jgi:hypothetical protein